jgi:glycerol kinase
LSEGLLLGIDAGTTAVKAALFDHELRPVAEARRAVAVTHPRAGWVEQDPELILAAVLDAVAEVLERARGREILAAGLDHQGESVLAWDRDSGRALTPVIVWQDKRQEALLAAIAATEDGARVAERSGMPLDPYFSAGKLAWLLANDEAVQRARAAGTLRLGTVDAFLVDRLGGRFATDLSTASRTQLLARDGRDWDEELLATFGVRREWLPALGPSFGALGELRHERWPVALALTAQLVDQQAALAGSGAVRAGELKASYGTGVFVLGRTREAVRADGLLPTVAWAAPDAAGQVVEVAHALDGGVFAAGSLLDWLATGLGLAPDAAALAAAAAAVGDSGGVTILPALSGLGAPWWRPGAHGVIAGLHAGVRVGHVGHAALEAIAWRVADIVGAFATTNPVELVRVDGGLTNDETLLQIQADALGVALSVGPADTTVLGAAMLAGVGAGAFASVEDAAARLPAARVIEPRASPQERAAHRERTRRSPRTPPPRAPPGLPRCARARGSRASARHRSRARAAAPLHARGRPSRGSRGRAPPARAARPGHPAGRARV